MAITLTTSAQVVGSAQDGGFRAELLAWYSNKSGNTATVHVSLRVTFIDSNYTYYYGTNKSYSLNFNGTSSAQYASNMQLNSPVTMAERTQSMSGGSTINASGSWYSYNYGNFSVGLSDTVQLPAFIIAPATPTLTIVNDNAHQNTITFGTTSFGNPSSGNIKLWRSTSSTFSSETLLDTQTTTGPHTYVDTSRTADTTYYYRTRATNGSASSDYVSGNVTTRKAVYVPDENEETILVQKLIVPYNGLSKYVLKLYRGDSNDEAERIY